MKIAMMMAILNGFILYGCTKEKTISEPGYTIGKIYQYVPGWAEGPTSVRFEYEINNKQYHTGYTNGDNGWQIPGNAGYEPGDMFMVQYELEDVKMARMLFDYPVKDSADYRNYLEKFKITAP